MRSLSRAGDSLSNQSFVFDPLGNLTSRTWLNGSTVTKENACYDARNRVTSTLITSGTACTGTGALTVAYDALGNITRKSDICNTANCYAYGGIPFLRLFRQLTPRLARGQGEVQVALQSGGGDL